MRVAFDIAQTATERAGCAWYADGLARALARRDDVQLEVFAHFGGWINASTEGIAAIPGATTRLQDLDADAARRFWAAAARDGLPGRPEIVHATSFEAPAVAGSRLVYTIHDLGFWTHPAFATEATRQVCQAGMLDALERAAGLAFVSAAARTEFEAILPGWLERSGRPGTVIPGASRFAPEPRLRPPPADAPWLCVGSIEPRKNHDTLLTALEIYRTRVRAPRPLLLIGGRGWHGEATHARIAALESMGAVRYPGYVADTDLAAAYRCAFALVQPSWHEGFGLPVVEAFGFDLPVLCADIPSLREAAGDAAQFVPPGSPERLADAMVALHEDSTRLERCAARSRATASRFSWDTSAARAVAFYHALRS